MESQNQRVLIITSVSAERDAVMRGLEATSRFDVLVSGVGIAAAAATTATALATKKYNLVISAGIGGGFVGQAEIGSVVVADEIICADMGAESKEGFISLDELGFGSTHIKVDQGLAANVSEALTSAQIQVMTGSVLTVSTVTGTKKRADELRSRIHNATVEAMEGFGVATAAQLHKIPVLEIRTVSNVVGPRDRESWKIKEALQILEQSFSVIEEVL
ncbi:futalosine hydrolase [Anaerobacillus sp. MEB173]|uniref:futalosine hydrolase n=1 Tax=Anaerobacillus sp. MEB173 TaxID=3383345 RepID=UPI003F91D2BA